MPQLCHIKFSCYNTESLRLSATFNTQFDAFKWFLCVLCVGLKCTMMLTLHILVHTVDGGKICTPDTEGSFFFCLIPPSKTTTDYASLVDQTEERWGVCFPDGWRQPGYQELLRSDHNLGIICCIIASAKWKQTPHPDRQFVTICTTCTRQSNKLLVVGELPTSVDFFLLLRRVNHEKMWEIEFDIALLD